MKQTSTKTGYNKRDKMKHALWKCTYLSQSILRKFALEKA